MVVKFPRIALVAGVITLVSGPWATAQVAQPAVATATHKHYESAPQANQPGPNGELAPRLQNLGTHTFPVSTATPAAQRFINQGLNLAYAFNHAEARRAFREAARLDPNAGDRLLGPGAGPRAEHQRGDGAQRGAARLRAGPEGAVAQGPGDAA